MLINRWSILLAFSLLLQFGQAQESDTSFVICDGGPVWPYYYPDLLNKASFWDIKKHFENEYPYQRFKSLEHNSGIITVQFVVNCEGQMGNFKVLTCDLNYLKKELNSEISTYFFQKTKQLTQWIVATDANGNKVNSHKFYSFRIQNGALLQILPK